MRQRLFHVNCLLPAVLLAWAVCCAGQNQSNPITIGQVVQIQSEILKQSRSLTISEPDGYDSGTDRYPVLYLLDGEDNFEFTASIVRFRADARARQDMRSIRQSLVGAVTVQAA